MAPDMMTIVFAEQPRTYDNFSGYTTYYNTYSSNSWYDDWIRWQQKLDFRAFVFKKQRPPVTLRPVFKTPVRKPMLAMRQPSWRCGRWKARS